MTTIEYRYDNNRTTYSGRLGTRFVFAVIVNCIENATEIASQTSIPSVTEWFIEV